LITAPCSFPDSSVGKEYACNAGDPGLIPESGRCAGEGIGYPLQYSWASLGTLMPRGLVYYIMENCCRTQGMTVNRVAAIDCQKLWAWRDWLGPW